MPAVSVLIPTYEPKPEHLRAAMDSVLAQTFTDWELIVHDDASKSDVEAIVKPFLSDPRIRFFRSEKNLGIGGNWNATMRKGLGEFIAYIFQDDLWSPSYLERSITILTERKDVGFTAANHAYTIEGSLASVGTGIYDEVQNLRKAVMTDGRIERQSFLNRWIERGLRPNLIGEPSFVVLRRSLMTQAGPFLEDMKQGLDAEYWIRCLLKADGWWIDENLGAFRVHASGTTAKNEETGAGRSDRLRTFALLVGELPPGPMKRLARSTMRREMLKMGWKWLKRKLRRG